MVNGMAGVDPKGLRIVGFGTRTLLHAVDLVVGLPIDDRAKLKVRSGEHLAAILATAVFLKAPSGVDHAGDADLRFDNVPEDRCYDLFSAGDQVIEIKSLGSAFRRYEASSTVGDTYQQTVIDARGLLEPLDEALHAAADQLSTRGTATKHVFIIVHPLEYWLVEHFDNPHTIGAALPPVRLPDGVDALWLLLHQDQLVIWSPVLAQWTQIMFDLSAEPEELPDGGFDWLQHAEDVFLASLSGGPHSSPFLYRLQIRGASDES